MRFFLIFNLLGLTLLSGCSSRKEEHNLSGIELDSAVSNYVLEFVKANQCESCLNDISIDKIFPDSTIITIRTQMPYANYLHEHPVRKIFKINDVPFFVYTGAEQFVRFWPQDTMENFPDGDSCSLAIWTIINSKGKNSYLKYGGEPFYYPDYSSPEAIRKDVYFLPPDSGANIKLH